MNSNPGPVSLLVRCLGATLALAGAACSEPGGAEGDVGAASIAVTSAPADVTCVRVTVSGSRTVVRLLDVTPGQSTVFTVTGLPIGADTFTADAFDVACATVGTTSVPTWLSDPVQAVVASGMVTPVTLQLRRNGVGSISIDFADDGAGGGGMGGVQVLHVAAGDRHSCAIVGTAVKCWGANEFGQLGDGTFGGASTPRTVSLGAPDTVVPLDVVVGREHSCALLSNGTAKCWGRNHLGQLGDFTGVDNPTPTPVFGQNTITAIASGANHVCAIRSAGDAICWGDGSRWQLGNGGNGPSFAPVGVGNVVTATGITAGTGHTCATRITAPQVQCWGDNTVGQLGNGEKGMVTSGTFAVVGLNGTVQALSAGGEHTCALVGGAGSGGVFCWGSNSEGQFGDGTFLSSPTPTAGPTFTSAPLALTAGRNHTCVLAVDKDPRMGRLTMCWGLNAFGQLGDNTVTTSNTPVAIKAGSGVQSIAAGARHTCAGGGGGSVRCWGSNLFGQLGDGTTVDHLLPTPVVF